MLWLTPATLIALRRRAGNGQHDILLPKVKLSVKLATQHWDHRSRKLLLGRSVHAQKSICLMLSSSSLQHPSSRDLEEQLRFLWRRRARW